MGPQKRNFPNEREKPVRPEQKQTLSSPTIHQPQPLLSAVEARRRRTEAASAERPQERVTRRPRGRDDEDVRSPLERLLAPRGAGLGDGIRHKNVREDDEIARRESRRCVLHVKHSRRDIYVLILGSCAHKIKSY